MAETIRGLNIVLGAETVGLQKALSDVNRQSRSIQGELSQVQRLLRMDPSNTELVAQKQKLLADAIANAGEKLNRLKSVQEQVNEQFRKGEISEAQWRAFQREVAAAEQALKRFEEQAGASKRTIEDMGNALQTAGERMKGVGQAMTVGITAPVIAAGGLMLKGAVDAEAAQGKLKASLGLTADEAKRLGDITQEVWKSGFGENITEVNQAVVSVRQNMAELSDNELPKVTEGAMTIADVFNQDVNEVAAAAGVAMKNFGISGQQALDLITVGFQKGGDFSGELLDTIREYSPQFATMGMSADQMLGILIEGAQAGAWNLDKVGDAVKEFNIRAQDGSKTTAEGFAAIGLNADKMAQAIAQGGEKGQQAFVATVAALAAMKDPVQQNIAGVNLFGTQWEDLRGKVVTAMADGVKGLGDFKGATEEAAKDAYDNNPALALTMAMRELTGAIGPALLPLADVIKNTISPAIKDLADRFANLSPHGQKVAVVIAGIGVAAGPALMAIGSMATGFTSVAGAVTKVIGTVATLVPKLASLVLGMGPVGIVIAALVAAGILLWQNWDTVKAKAEELWKKLGEIWGNIKTALENIWNGIKEFFKKWGDDILLVAVGPAGWAVLLARKLGITWDDIKIAFSTAWDTIKRKATEIWEGIVTIVKNGANSIIGLVNGVIGAYERMINGLANAINSIPDIEIPEWVPGIGGGTFGLPEIPTITLPKIPYLAEGGLVMSPTLAMLGEAGPEAVFPVKRLTELGRMLGEALADGIAEGLKGMPRMAALSPAVLTPAFAGSYSSSQTTYGPTTIQKIEINGNDADEIWEKFSRELGKRGVRL